MKENNQKLYQNEPNLAKIAPEEKYVYSFLKSKIRTLFAAVLSVAKCIPAFPSPNLGIGETHYGRDCRGSEEKLPENKFGKPVFRKKLASFRRAPPVGELEEYLKLIEKE